MKLYLLQNVQGDRLPICDFPGSLLSSRTGLSNFLRLHASRVFGGSEGKDWRVCSSFGRTDLVPLTVNQLVRCGPDGHVEYGQQLVIE